MILKTWVRCLEIQPTQSSSIIGWPVVVLKWTTMENLNTIVPPNWKSLGSISLFLLISKVGFLYSRRNSCSLIYRKTYGTRNENLTQFLRFFCFLQRYFQCVASIFQEISPSIIQTKAIFSAYFEYKLTENWHKDNSTQTSRFPKLMKTRMKKSLFKLVCLTTFSFELLGFHKNCDRLKPTGWSST